MKRSEKPKCRPGLELEPVTLVRGVRASSSCSPSSSASSVSSSSSTSSFSSSSPWSPFSRSSTLKASQSSPEASRSRQTERQLENQNLWRGKRSTGILHLIAWTLLTMGFFLHRHCLQYNSTESNAQWQYWQSQHVRCAFFLHRFANQFPIVKATLQFTLKPTSSCRCNFTWRATAAVQKVSSIKSRIESGATNYHLN